MQEDRARIRPEAFRADGPELPRSAMADGAGLGAGLKLHHDIGEGGVEVMRYAGAKGYGLALSAGGGEGGYVSLVAEPWQGSGFLLRATDLLRVEAEIATPAPRVVYLRANVETGPNVERSAVERAVAIGRVQADFDVAALGFDPARESRFWIDLILPDFAASRAEIGDLVIGRRPRGGF